MVVTCNGVDAVLQCAVIFGLLEVACAVTGDRAACDQQAGFFVTACGAAVWFLSMPLVVLSLLCVVELVLRGL